MQRIAPDSGIVYVDNDPAVILHAKALLDGPGSLAPEGVVSYVEADLRDPASIDFAVQKIAGPVHALFSCAGMGSASDRIDILLCNFCGTRHLTAPFSRSIAESTP